MHRASEYYIKSGSRQPVEDLKTGKVLHVYIQENYFWFQQLNAFNAFGHGARLPCNFNTRKIAAK